MFVLVRHAHAGNKRLWPAPDDERPLSPRGQAEALGVATLLTEVGVTRLLSSPSLRCLQTLEPAAMRLGVPVEPCEALTADAAGEDLLRLLASGQREGTALCTHGETLKTLSAAWAPTWRWRGGAPPDLAGTPKAGCWVVEGYATPAAAVRFVAPGPRP